jgi:hypothetical protein
MSGVSSSSWPGREHQSRHGARSGMLEDVTRALVVHRPSPRGGRQVTVHRHGRDEVLGTAYSDHDLVVFLEAAGIADPDAVLDQPQWVEWRDGPAHDFSAG